MTLSWRSNKDHTVKKLFYLACSFQSSYPSWEPNPEGKQFLLNLRTFREQKLQEQYARYGYSAARMWRGGANLRGHVDRNSILSREIPLNPPVTGHHSDSLWLIDADQKSHPYLLDWYYMSRPEQVSRTARISQVRLSEATEQYPGDFWMQPKATKNDARNNDYWENQYEDRWQSHLEASTSAPFFRESVLQHHEASNVGQHTRSHWWARSSPRGAQTESFLEPPDFNRYIPDNYHDNFFERSEEQDQFLDWRSPQRLSQTAYTDDLEVRGGDVSLHFDDIYSRPPESPILEIKPPTF